ANQELIALKVSDQDHLVKSDMVMAALVISISSDVSVKSVRSFFPRVILIGSIYVEVSVAQNVGAATVASSVRVFELELDTKIPKRHASPTPHDAMLNRWRSRVSLRSSSPTTSTPEIHTDPILPIPSTIVAPSSEFLLALVVAPPEIHHSSSRHSSSGHSLSGHTPADTTIADSSTPLRFVHPPLARTLRCWINVGIGMEIDVGVDVDDEVEDEVESSDRGTMEVEVDMVAGIDIHDGMVMPNAIERLEQVEEGQRESEAMSMIAGGERASLLEQEIEEFVNQRVKEALAAYEATRAANALEAENQSQNSSNGDNGNKANRNGKNENGGNGNPNENDRGSKHVAQEDIEADATSVEVVVDRDVEAGINVGIGMEIDVGVDVDDEVEDEVESSDRGTMEVEVDMVVGIDIHDGMVMPNAIERLEQVEEGQRESEAMSMIAGGERASLLEQVVSLERRNTRLRDSIKMVRARADRLETFAVRRLEALAAYEATCAANALEAENQSQNSSNGDNGNEANRNGKNENGGNGNPNENDRGSKHVARECTYQDFMKCQPLNFKGTEGVVGLIRGWKLRDYVDKVTFFPVKDKICIFATLKHFIESIISNVMPMNSISSRDGRLPCYEVIDDYFRESGVIHFIASLLTFVLHLIYKIFPDEIGKVNVNYVIESPKHFSLRQSETVNSKAFACKALVDH
nr:hypothetical protein [Tanacetum cinerariifolium]